MYHLLLLPVLVQVLVSFGSTVRPSEMEEARRAALLAGLAALPWTGTVCRDRDSYRS